MLCKRVILLFLSLGLLGGFALLFPCSTEAQEALPLEAASLETYAATDHFLLQFEPWATEEQRAQLLQDANLRELKRITGQLSVVQTVPVEGPEGAAFSAQALLSAMEMVNQSYLVDYAEPDFLNDVHAVPNDAYYAGYQYYLHNTGQSIMGQVGYTDDDIDVQEAWDVTQGSDEVIIAVIDTGADTDIPELSGRWYVNSGEIPYNSIDDDNNGFIDDYIGWDFALVQVNPDRSCSDIARHGTQCASVIGANTNNGVGVAGVLWNRGKIMPLKVFEYIPASGKTQAYTSSVVSGMHYAANNGAHIISMSLGSFYTNLDYQHTTYINACNTVRDSGVMIFASSGNDDANHGGGPTGRAYPASCTSAFGVGAVDNRDQITDFSNANWDTGLSPLAQNAAATGHGLDILVAGPYSVNGPTNFWIVDGTSFSCPEMAGVAGLALSYYPSFRGNPDSTTELMINACEDVGDSGLDLLYGWGRINAAYALKRFQGDVLDHFDLSAPSSLSANETITVTITAQTAGGDTVDHFTRASLWVSNGTLRTGVFGNDRTFEFVNGVCTQTINVSEIPTTLYVNYADVTNQALLLEPYEGSELYVSDSVGTDFYNGSETYPFKTIARALQALDAGETIHIAAGFYSETITLFGDSDNVTIIGDFDTGGITADSSNVIIDASVNGDSSSGAGFNFGIYLMSGLSGAVLTDLQIQNAYHGICLNSADNNHLEDLTARLCYQGGLALIGSETNTIARNLITANTISGLALYNASSHNTICTNVIATNNSLGLLLSNDCRSNQLTGNIIRSNGETGVSLSGASENLLSHNLIANNQRGGIELKTLSVQNEIFQNDLFRNGRGFFGVSDNLFIDAASETNLIRHNNILQAGRFNINTVSGAWDLRYNYYGATDSQAVADSLSALPADSWIPFRFNWMDTAPGADAYAPAEPQNLTGSGGTSTVTLTWSPVNTDEGGGALTGLGGYRVYRFTNRNQIETGSIQPSIGAALASETSFVDSNPVVGPAYYVVTAFDTKTGGANEGWYSRPSSQLGAYALRMSLHAQNRPDTAWAGVTVHLIGPETQTIGLTSSDSGHCVFDTALSGTYRLEIHDTHALTRVFAPLAIYADGTADTAVLTIWTLLGDCNQDGVINDYDLSIVTSQFDPSTPNNGPADATNNNVVDLEDLLTVMGNFSQSSEHP